MGTLQCKTHQEPGDGSVPIFPAPNLIPQAAKNVDVFASVEDIKDFLSCFLQLTHPV